MPVQRFVQAGDVRLQCFEAGEGSRTAVLVHGASSSARIWHAVQERLAEAGIRTFAPGMRGAGGSDHTADERDYTPMQYAADLAAALDALEVSRFTLVGHSLGVSTALNFIHEHSDRFDVQALILMAGGLSSGRPEPDAEERARIEQRLGRAPAGTEAERRAQWEPNHGGLPEEVRDALWRDIQNNPPQRQRGQALGARPDLSDVIASMAVPVLVVGGDDDRVVPLEATLRCYQALPAERRHLHVFHGVSHFPNAHVPDRLAGVFQRFIEQQVPV